MKKQSILSNDSIRAIIASVLSIVIGLVFGAIAIAIVGAVMPEINGKGVWEGIRLVLGGLISTGRDEAGILTWGFNGTNI